MVHPHPRAGVVEPLIEARSSVRWGDENEGVITIVTPIGGTVISGRIEWAKTENGSVIQLAKPVRAYAP